MFPNPPDISQQGFLTLLDTIIERVPQYRPILGGTRPCLCQPGEPPELIHHCARLAVVLEGQEEHIISVHGKREHIRLHPGAWLYLPPRAWTVRLLSTPFEGFGVVFMPQTVRLIQIIITEADVNKPAPPTGTPWAYHTASPLSESGTHVLRALNCLAEENYAERPTRDLSLSLLGLVRRQLAEDVPSRHSHHRAWHTWQAVQDYLETHFDGSVSRESVAEALGLHPNYLSTLARQAAGQSFRHVLETVRMLNARRLLRDTDLKLARIATLCGYSSASRLATVFHRTSGITPGRFRGETRRSTSS